MLFAVNNVAIGGIGQYARSRITIYQ